MGVSSPRIPRERVPTKQRAQAQTFPNRSLRPQSGPIEQQVSPFCFQTPTASRCLARCPNLRSELPPRGVAAPLCEPTARSCPARPWAGVEESVRAGQVPQQQAGVSGVEDELAAEVKKVASASKSLPFLLQFGRSAARRRRG